MQDGDIVLKEAGTKKRGLDVNWKKRDTIIKGHLLDCA